MICRCRVCKKQIVGKLSNVYKHLSECHHIDVDTIHAAEKHICFHWNTDAPKNGIIIPDNLQELVKNTSTESFLVELSNVKFAIKIQTGELNLYLLSAQFLTCAAIVFEQK